MDRKQVESMLTPDVRQRVEAADEATLDRWLGRVFAAATVEDVFRTEDA